MESRSLCGCATATGPVVRMQPDRASAVMMAMIGNRNTRATRTGAIPHSETALVLHRLWLTNGFCAVAGEGENSRAPLLPGEGRGEGLSGPQALKFVTCGTSPSPGLQGRHSRSFASAFFLMTAAKGGLCLSPQAAASGER